jgi:hypothetical protein
VFEKKKIDRELLACPICWNLHVKYNNQSTKTLFHQHKKTMMIVGRTIGMLWLILVTGLSHPSRSSGVKD